MRYFVLANHPAVLGEHQFGGVCPGTRKRTCRRSRQGTSGGRRHAKTSREAGNAENTSNTRIETSADDDRDDDDANVEGRVKNPRLEARLLQLLPAGTNINEAARGFKNWGQFVAAVHVSNNQNIPFMELKSRMVGPGAVSLGQAIQASRSRTPTASTHAVKVAEQEAAEDFRFARNDRN